MSSFQGVGVGGVPLYSEGWNRCSTVYRGVFISGGCPHFRGLGSTGVLVSGDWNREVPIYTGVLISGSWNKGIHCIQRYSLHSERRVGIE